MWTEILSFNGTVFVLNVEFNEWLNLHLSCFEYNVDTRKFIATTRTSQQFKSLPSDPRCESRLFCLGFKVLLDRHCGIFLPFFVAQVNDNLCYLFCLDSHKHKWIVKCSFEVPKSLGQTVHLTRVDYSIANGPTIIWITGNEIFIYKAQWSLEKNTVSLLKLAISDMVANIELDVHISGRILWWDDGLCSEACDCEYGLVLFKPDKLSAMVSAYLVTLDNHQKKTASITSTISIIPPLYLSITTCSCVFFESSTVAQAHFANVPYKVFISTTQSQLVEFFQGQYVKHVNISFSDCKTLEVFENLAGDLILLCSQENQVCAIEWKTSKILKTWSNFDTLLTDDFVGTGTNQVLLFSGNSKEHERLCEDFILTDLLRPDDELIRTEGQVQDNLKSINDPDSPKSKENSMDKVVYALNKKVKATEESITECKLEKSEKLSFLQEHCNTLHDILMNRKPVCSFQTSSLASLLTGSETSSCEDKSRHDCSKLAVTAEWQDLCDLQWVVGLEIENVGESIISDISLSLVNKNRGILWSSSKICMTGGRHKNWNELQLHDNVSNLVPGERLAITTTTVIPNYTCEPRFGVALMLSWKQGTEGNYVAQIFGEMILSVQDVLNPEARKPIFQSRVCQHVSLSTLETQVIVSTRNTNTSSAIELLKSKMDVCQCCSAIHFCEKYRSSKSFLREVHISFAIIENDAIVTIFSRNVSQLCMTLYMLKQNLPDDVIWRPLRTKKIIDGAVKYAEEELVSTIEKLTNLLKVRGRKKIGTDRVELPGDKNEEISVKRRKLSHFINTDQREYDESSDLSDCLKTFSDISSHSIETERIFESLLLIWKTLE